MKLERKDLDEAVGAGVLGPDQAEALWGHLTARAPQTASGFGVVAYFGAFLVIGSLTWFATQAFGNANPAVLVVTALAYLVGFGLVGHLLHRRRPGGLEAELVLTIAVFVVPLAVYSVQKLFGLFVYADPGTYTDFFVWVNRGWFAMELMTVGAAVAVLAVYRAPLAALPLAFVLWFFSMDVVPMLFGGDFTWDQRRLVSMVFGLGMLAVSYGLDLRRKGPDLSFWLYLFGLLSFWGALSVGSTDHLGLKVLYGLLNAFLAFVGVLFGRKVFLVFGSLGLFLFFYDLANVVFRDSFFFPLVLTALGVAVLAGGFALMRAEARIVGWVSRRVPASVLRWVPVSSRSQSL